jgi:rSAM/selenodomain-associated transferase 1
MKYPEARLILMTKAPDPGLVKTRLIPLLGAEAAAGLYSSLVHEFLEKTVTAELCPVDVWCSPAADHHFFQDCLERYRIELHVQMQGDLGMRMSTAIQATLQIADHAVLVGADCPSLATADIDAGFNALQQGADVVLGPAEDGGYYLIGMSAHYGKLFEGIPWSTREVYTATVARLQTLGLNLYTLPIRRDIDTADDYAVYLAAS